MGESDYSILYLPEEAHSCDKSDECLACALEASSDEL